jgi:tetratricopeptide (TPR) repeat protein
LHNWLILFYSLGLKIYKNNKPQAARVTAVQFFMSKQMPGIRMVPYRTLKLIIVSTCVAFLLNGCGATHSGTPAGRAETPIPATQQVPQEPASQAPSPEQTGQTVKASAQTSFGDPDSDPEKSTVSRKVLLDYADIEFVQLRLDEYESKFEYWLEISEMTQEGDLAEELAALEKECILKLERILSGYALLLERMRQDNTVPLDSIATVDPKKIQQLDIAFLESRCGELLAMDIPAQDEFIPESEQKLSFDAAQKVIASGMEQGNYQEVLLAYGRLARDFPAQKPFLSTRLNYGLALQYTGQVEAAARHLKKLLESDDLSIEPFSLQREIADLLLASGDVAAAESYYDSVLLRHESIWAEKLWAEEQLAFLRSVEPESEDMIAYVKLLRKFQMYDYKIDALRLNEAINAFAAQYTGSPFAVSALRLKTFALAQLKAWFDSQLDIISSLVAEKKFPEATGILKNMTRYYLPAELQALLQKTYYEVAQAEIQEIETQRRIQEMELTEQWDAAINLLDSQRFDIAISAFTALMGTEYEEKAKIKITEAANRAASQMRKEAASLFIKAGQTPDPDQKKILLLASHSLLTEILTKYPQTDLLEKVQQNITILEVQIKRFDPALLEELQQENPAGLPPGPSATPTGQLQ